MTTISQSRRLMKATLARASGKIRGIIALELLLDTLVLALGALVKTRFTLPLCAYFIALISLYVQIPLARAAR